MHFIRYMSFQARFPLSVWHGCSTYRHSRCMTKMFQSWYQLLVPQHVASFCASFLHVKLSACTVHCEEPCLGLRYHTPQRETWLAAGYQSLYSAVMSSDAFPADHGSCSSINDTLTTLSTRLKIYQFF